MRRAWWIVLAVLAMLLAACGGQETSGSGTDGTTSIDVRDVAESLSAANDQLIRAAQPLALAGVPVPVPLVPLSDAVAPLDTAAWNCEGVTVSGTLTDADADGIPVDATYNGRCTWSYSGSEGTFSGYWEYRNLVVQDPDDADPEAGIQSSGTVEWGYEGGSQPLVWTWTLTQHDLVKQAGGYGFTYKGRWQVVVNATDNYTFDYDLTGAWVPDDATNPWGDGTLDATGSFSGDGPDCTNGWSLTVSLSGVHFTAGKIDAGTADYSGTDCDGASAAVHVRWSATEVCVTVGTNEVCVPNG